jgi:hypothetical protein
MLLQFPNLLPLTLGEGGRQLVSLSEGLPLVRPALLLLVSSSQEVVVGDPLSSSLESLEDGIHSLFELVN